MVSDSEPPRLELVVSAGPDLGARMAVANDPALVGRDRKAALRLTDLTVSRRHLQVLKTNDAVDVRTLEGAAPFKIGDTTTDKATLAGGDKLVVGKTALTVVARRDEPSSHLGNTCEVTDVRTLLDQAVVGTKGLAAIFQLSERLDDASEIDEVCAAFVQWAHQHVNPEMTGRLVDDGDDDDEEMVERPHGDGHLQVSLPLIGAAPAVLVFEMPSGGKRLSNELRTMLAVAARVMGSTMAKLRTLHRVTSEASELRRIALGTASSFLGDTAEAQKVTKLMTRLARSEAVALIVGETGAGKTFLSRLIHESSPRCNEPFRVINCAAIPDNLVEAELFGYEKGAFTGAAGARTGALEAAGEGTVLLDELGDLPLVSQAKLLRVLDEGQFERLGSNSTLQLRARVLAATNRDLKQMVEQGTFRSDLYFRISAVSVLVPPLRDRRGDIAMLAERFLADLAPSAGRRVTGWSEAAIATLEGYGWPGNVRELRNVIEHALVLGDGPIIEPSDLPHDVTGHQPAEPTDGGTVTLPMDLATLEQHAIQAALDHTGGNRTKAAALLGINRVTLYKKLRTKGDH